MAGDALMPGSVAPKRFFEDVLVIERDGRYELRLDDRSLRTRGRNIVHVPTRGLAEAIRDEWAGQGERIDPAATPITSLVSAAIDAGVEGARPWRDDILSYLATDLLCYRADAPESLVTRQEEAWDPVLDWLRSDMGVGLVSTAGVIKVEQPDIAIQAARSALERATPLETLAVRQAATLTGSAAVALALWRGAFPAEALFDASLVDETFQAEKWGVDEEAAERRAQMRSEFARIAKIFEFLRA
jgi:chaperone required for assembly of F1-ATPase